MDNNKTKQFIEIVPVDYLLYGVAAGTVLYTVRYAREVFRNIIGFIF